MEFAKGVRVLYTMDGQKKYYGKVLGLSVGHILVEYDERPPWGGHDGGGGNGIPSGKPGHCWWHMDYDHNLKIAEPTTNRDAKSLLKRR